MVGLLAAWFQNPFYFLCTHAISGEFADCGRWFTLMLLHPETYWLMVTLGILIPGLTFYAVQLFRMC